MSRRERKRMMVIQRIIGLGLVAIGILIIIMGAHATRYGDVDMSGGFLIVPAGLYFLLTRKCIFNEKEIK